MQSRVLLLTGLMATLTGCQARDTRVNAANSPGPGAVQAPGTETRSHGGDVAVMDHGAHPSMARLSQASKEDFDATFASLMIEHHHGAVEMSEQALPHLKRPEVQRAARKIIADQRAENSQMTRWVEEWTGHQPSADLRRLMRRDMQPMMDAFKRDCADDCDRAFLTHMIAHHQMAVQMAETAAQRAQHPELKQMVEQMARTQGEEIRQFRQLLGQ